LSGIWVAVRRLPRLLALAAFCFSHHVAVAQIVDSSGEKTWTDSTGQTRIRLIGSNLLGWEAQFEVRLSDGWEPTASFPAGHVWTVYSAWNTPPNSNSADWYSGAHSFGASELDTSEKGEPVLRGHGDIAGQHWDFEDRYSFEHQMVKVVRRWHHTGGGKQRAVTLVTAVRVPVDEDPRVLLPGILYNGNPGSYPTKPVYKLPYVPDAKALYEEHRFPIPFVNLESSISGNRISVSLLAVPSKVAQAHKGNDQWWSLGLDWRWDGHVDLLSVSGAVMTNGMPSMVYGHRNGFDPYRDAYIDVDGDVTFEKQLYLDCGINRRVGYGFRETVWKAFDMFQPIETPHLDLREAIELKANRVKQAVLKGADGVEGIPVVSQYRRFIYGWVGDNLATAYGLLDYGQRTGNEEFQRMGIDIANFFVDHCRRDTAGLLYGDYDVDSGKWLTSFYQGWDWPESISSRQLGEILDHLADLVEWGEAHGLRDAARWRALLIEAGTFLISAQRYEGTFPRSWYPDGRPVNWNNGKPEIGAVTTSGAFLVAPLAKLYVITGDKRFLDTAASALRGYYDMYGRDLHLAYSGATLDAGSEDKEAGAGMLHGAMTLYLATKNREYLQWAQDAADWLTTWYYMYDVQFPASSPVSEVLHTIGWTSISVQNQEIDSWGSFMAPDFYRLGRYLADVRYQEIAQTMFLATTQTITRPGSMLGQTTTGSQPEHCNQTNCTHVPNGAWRGSCWTFDISWVYASTLYNGAWLGQLGALPWNQNSRVLPK
jgi:hypothetical protein